MPKPLTTVAIANLKRKPKRYEVPDPGCPGMKVVIFPTGKKSYILRFRYRGLQRKLTLGPVLSGVDESDTAPELGTPLTLASARQLATKALREAKTGKDPAAAKLAARQEQQAAESDTLQATCDLYLKREGPRMRTVSQRKSDLELLCSKLGRLPVAEIRRSQFTHVLEHIHDNNGPQRAHRCQSALRTLLNWYAGRSDDYVSPLVRGGTQRASTPRDRTLTNDELRAVWNAAEQDQGPFGRFVMFTLLTATRRGEGAGMTRDELSDDGKTWIIPAARYKTGKDTLIPLSEAAQKIVASMPGLGDYVFSFDGSKPLQGFHARKKALDKISGVQREYTLHDLRRTARTLLSKCPGVTPDHAERCLGHAIGGVRGVYDLHGYEDEKRHAFEALAALVETIVHPSDNVVPMTGKARRKKVTGSAGPRPMPDAAR